VHNPSTGKAEAGDHEFQASLDYIVKFYSKEKNKPKKKRKEN
jgi:hypothetical protein